MERVFKIRTRHLSAHVTYTETQGSKRSRLGAAILQYWDPKATMSSIEEDPFERVKSMVGGSKEDPSEAKLLEEQLRRELRQRNIRFLFRGALLVLTVASVLNTQYCRDHLRAASRIGLIQVILQRHTHTKKSYNDVACCWADKPVEFDQALKHSINPHSWLPSGTGVITTTETACWTRPPRQMTTPSSARSHNVR